MVVMKQKSNGLYWKRNQMVAMKQMVVMKEKQNGWQEKNQMVVMKQISNGFNDLATKFSFFCISPTFFKNIIG